MTTPQTFAAARAGSTNDTASGPNLFTLTLLEPVKLRRKINAILPIGLILLFGFWAVAVTSATYGPMEPSERDPRSMILTVVQLGSLMLPLIIGASALILVAADTKHGMVTRLQTVGLSARTIGTAKAAWTGLAALLGIAAVVLGTGWAASLHDVSYPGNSLVVAVWALLAETIVLVPLLLNLSLRTSRQGFLLALILFASLLGSAGHMIPKSIAVWIPFTFAGGTSVVGVHADGIFDTPITPGHLAAVTVITVVVTAASIIFFPRRSTHEH